MSIFDSMEAVFPTPQGCVKEINEQTLFILLEYFSMFSKKIFFPWILEKIATFADYLDNYYQLTTTFFLFMNTKLQLFCAIILCFTIGRNTAFSADNGMSIRQTTNREVKSNTANIAYDEVATRSTLSANEITQVELSIVKSLLDNKGLGFPKPNAKSRINLKRIYDAPKKYTKEDLQKARQEYIDDTDVEKPEHGKRYTIKFYGYDQHAFLLDYSNGKVSTREFKSGQVPNESACFTAHVFENGKVAFQTVDKKWLGYPIQMPAPDWLKDFAPNGVTNKLDEATNGLELQKAGKGNHVKSENFLNLFGKFYIKSKRGTRVNNNEDVQGIWVLKTSDNTFDGASDPYYNETFSSVILIEQVKGTAGIQQIDTAAKRISENKIYTLSGQRIFVEKLSELQRGIYIVNGKKLLVQ